MQVKNPARDIPIGMIASLTVITTLYLLAACAHLSAALHPPCPALANTCPAAEGFALCAIW